MMMSNIQVILYNVLKPYSAILFLNNKFAGFMLLLITFINPSVALSGIVAIFFTIIFAEFIGVKETYLSQGFYIYNSLLVGMSVGYLYAPTLISIAFIAIVSSFTFVLSFILNRLFSDYKIPILSLPFSIITIFLYLASLKYSGLLSSLVNNATLIDISVPLGMSGFLKSFGTIFFLPNNLAGMLMLFLVFYFSRIVVIMAFVGYYFGVFVHSCFIGSYEQALYDPYAFNYILVAVALCGVFLLPTVKNFVLTLIAVAISVILTDAISMIFNDYSIPVFTLPFNLTVITFIFTLSAIYYKEFNLNIKATPEESLSTYLSYIFRFGQRAAKISLPFSGKWSVYQEFDDEWTHKGKYKHAYDFVINQDGKSYENDGLDVKDYYCFGESILSATSGYVVDCRDDLADNVIGEVDRINNWGNYIIIKSDLGFFVEISHIMQYSIKVKVGDYVQAGSILAKCGNSGYSPQPHIHIQVQDIGVLGGFTREFYFSEYYDEDELIFNAKPKKGDTLGSVVSDRSISARLLFILDESFLYDVYESDEKIGEEKFTVKMNEYGEFYFEDTAQNRLYFYNDLKQFYFYNYIGRDSHLKWLFKLAPRVPFTNKKDTTFRDFLPLYLLKNRVKVIIIELLAIIKKDMYKVEVQYSFDGYRIQSRYGDATIDLTSKGFGFIKYNNMELRRIL